MTSYIERESIASGLRDIYPIADAYDRCAYSHSNHYAEEASIYRSIQSCINEGSGRSHVYTIRNLIELTEPPTTTIAIPKDSSVRDDDGNYLGTYKCLICGADVWEDLESVTPYCPMCGAKVVC